MGISKQRVLEKVEKELKRTDPGRRAAVFKIKERSLPPMYISKGLSDVSWKVRLAAMQHPSFSQEHIKKGLSDENRYCRVFTYVKALDYWPWEALDGTKNDAILYYDLLIRLVCGRCDDWEFRTDRVF